MYNFITRVFAAALVIISAAAIPAPASAQSAGIKGGVNFATLSDAEEFPDKSNRLGLVGGVWVRTAQRGRLSFQVEGLFSEKGLKTDIAEQGITVALDLRIRYIELPVLARFDLGATDGGFFLVGGVAPALKLGGQIKGEALGESETEDIGDELESLDFGLVGGAGVQFGRASIEARYTHGLLSINKDGNDDGESDSPKNRVFSVMVGFRLR